MLCRKLSREPHCPGGGAQVSGRMIKLPFVVVGEDRNTVCEVPSECRKLAEVRIMTTFIDGIADISRELWKMPGIQTQVQSQQSWAYIWEMVWLGCRAVGGAHPSSLGLTSSGNSSGFRMDRMRNGKNEWGNKWREWCLQPCGEHSPMSTDKLYLIFRHLLEAGSGLKTFKERESAFPRALWDGYPSMWTKRRNKEQTERSVNRSFYLLNPIFKNWAFLNKDLLYLVSYNG